MVMQLLLSHNQVDCLEVLADGMTPPLGAPCLGQAQDLLQMLALECEELLRHLVLIRLFPAPLGPTVRMPTGSAVATRCRISFKLRWGPCKNCIHHVGDASGA